MKKPWAVIKHSGVGDLRIVARFSTEELAQVHADKVGGRVKYRAVTSSKKSPADRRHSEVGS